MVATLAALATAVVTLVVYVVATDRMDYASVQRRQFDVWALVTGAACMAAILHGGAEVRREAGARDDGGPTAAPRRAMVERLNPASLYLVPPRTDLPDAVPPEVAIVPVESVPTAASVVGSSGRDGVGGDVDRPADGGLEIGAGTSATQAPLGVLDVRPWVRGVFTPVLGTRPTEAPAPTRVRVVLVPTPTLPPTVVPTAVPPTAEPTVAPPMPTATPHCGDPSEIVVDLEVIDAVFHRGGDMPTVRYRAHAINRSEFPVTLVNIAVVVGSRDIGSEQFGHARPPDVTIEPGALHALDGVVELTKSPPPFGQNQLCVSFVTETCKRSVPYQVTANCLPTHGF